MDTTYCVEFFSAALVDHTDALYATELTQPQRIDLLKEKSTQFREISVVGNDRLLTLSTCSTAGEDLRVIVTGRLIPIEWQRISHHLRGFGHEVQLRPFRRV